MPDVTSGAVPLLENALRFRVSRAAALAGNIANADTPGYRRVDVRFDALLEDAGRRLATTHPGHLPRDPASAGPELRVERGPRGTRPDGNGVDLASEVVRYSRNAGAFTDQAAVLSRLLSMTRAAIGGEPR